MRRGSNRGGMWRGGGPSRGRGFRGNFGNRPFAGNSWQNRNSNNSGPRTEKQTVQNRPKGKRLSEQDIGATEYMSDHEGFNAIIKLRYSDFQVAEINEQGEVAQLSTLAPPAPPAEEAIHEDEELLLCKYNVEILPMDTWDRINKLVVGTLPPHERVEIDVAQMSKEDRTKIHDAVKKAFGGSIVGSTVNIDDKKLMRFEKFRKGVRIDNRVKWVWPGEFVHFVVYKENCDTMEAAARIADRLRMQMKPQVLGYAGTKDRRAKTTQWFSLRKTDPRKIAAACAPSRVLALGNYSFHAHGLRLGALKGNRFRIALRNVNADEARVEAACERLRECGFINYYGLQRFGTRADVPTHAVGKLLLRGEYRQAIDLMLSVQADGPLKEVLCMYAESGANAAACALPQRLLASTEGRLLATLAQRPNDYLTALQRMPRNARLLYLHAYQSHVWNRAVSERLRRYGRAPVAGDAVPAHAHVADDEIEELSDNEETDIAESTHPDSQDNNKQTDKRHKPKEKIPVKILTQEDVDSGKYTMYDLVMPLPGCNVDYPPNMVEYYKTIMNEDGLELELISKQKSYTLSGAWRRVCVRARELAWSRARYSDPHADLIASDLDLLEGRPLTGILPDGKYEALLLTFSLPVSCYATMALRELLKVDTSSTHQAQFNDYHSLKRTHTPAEHGGAGDEGDGGAKRARTPGGDGDSGEEQ